MDQALYCNYSLKFPLFYLSISQTFCTLISQIWNIVNAIIGETVKMCESSKETLECCGKTFNTKAELEAHKEKMHQKGCCS
jgi:hypothetical protein